MREGYGAALTLELLNAAGGGMPSYLHDEVGSACRTLFTARADAAGDWVSAAAMSPRFAHSRVSGPAAASNYAMVLGYLAGHGVWEHFQTVLTRGVAVAETEEDSTDS